MASTGRQTVAPGQTIASQWGNLVWDQSINCFDTVGARDTQWPAPADGASCYIVATRTLYNRQSGAWRPVLVTAHANVTLAQVIPGKATVTTNASGAFTIIYGTGITMNTQAVVCNGEGTVSGVTTVSMASNGFNGTAWYPNGTAVASATIGVHYVAYGL